MYTLGLASRAGNKKFLEAQALLAAMRGKSPDQKSEVSDMETDQTSRRPR